MQRRQPPVAHRRDALQIEHDVTAGLIGGPLDLCRRLAHHHLGQIRPIDARETARLRHCHPVAQHGGLIAHRQHLVELVADVDDRAAPISHGAQGEPQVGRLGRSQHSGRLVQHHHVGVAPQRLQDLHALALAHRELPHRSGRVGLQRIGGRQVGDTLDDLAHVQVARCRAQHHVLEHRERRHQAELLVDHADPSGDRICGRVELLLGAVHPDLAGVGQVDAAQHIDQRGLAGAVLAQQRMDGARPHGEVRAVAGDCSWELLADAAQVDDYGTVTRTGGYRRVPRLRHRCEFGSISRIRGWRHPRRLRRTSPCPASGRRPWTRLRQPSRCRPGRGSRR